ncbi:hypothetical protein V8C37DRAFT_392596 [Trichoderma ceciliae]
MPDRGPSSRLAKPHALDRVFAAGDAVAEEAVRRAVYRHCAEQAALSALRRDLGGRLGRQLVCK